MSHNPRLPRVCLNLESKDTRSVTDQRRQPTTKQLLFVFVLNLFLTCAFLWCHHLFIWLLCRTSFPLTFHFLSPVDHLDSRNCVYDQPVFHSETLSFNALWLAEYFPLSVSCWSVWSKVCQPALRYLLLNNHIWVFVQLRGFHMFTVGSKNLGDPTWWYFVTDTIWHKPECQTVMNNKNMLLLILDAAEFGFPEINKLCLCEWTLTWEESKTNWKKKSFRIIRFTFKVQEKKGASGSKANTKMCMRGLEVIKHKCEAWQWENHVLKRDGN